MSPRKLFFSLSLEEQTVRDAQRPLGSDFDVFALARRCASLSRCSALIGKWMWGDTPHAPRAWATPPRPLLSQSALNITVAAH